MIDSPHEVTRLLEDWNQGDKRALDQLIPLIEGELRQLARRYMRRQRSGHTLQTTALVNEAYLRLAGQQNRHWQNREHFFAVAAQLMRNILVDYARRRHAAKRGGEMRDVTLDESVMVSQERAIEVLALDEALRTLAEIDPRKSKIVELRYFGGLTFEQAAAVLDISPVTARRDWRGAKAWLYRALSEKGSLA